MEKLKDFRAKRNLTLKELGDMVGLSPVTIWDLEHGNKRARPETAIKLEKVTGINRSYFVFGDPH